MHSKNVESLECAPLEFSQNFVVRNRLHFRLSWDLAAFAWAVGYQTIRLALELLVISSKCHLQLNVHHAWLLLARGVLK